MFRQHSVKRLLPCLSSLALFWLMVQLPVCHCQPLAQNLTATLPEMVKAIDRNNFNNNFCWGEGLSKGANWKTMWGKVAGCLLDKSEIIAMQWDVADNRSESIDSPARFYRNLAIDLASCCTMSEREWCVEEISPAYALLVALEKDPDETDFGADEADLASIFATVTKAAAQLLEEYSEQEDGYSSRAALLLGTCAIGSGGADGSLTTCFPEDLERVRRLLEAQRDEL
mmetsp:Transcript_102097/g.259460  ORF Transcript_102097/g.259460 Transcript_102097/m.259460 type:complete len:228 (-) Transcript_102097:38-721(-)